jgi:hypothetical protein
MSARNAPLHIGCTIEKIKAIQPTEIGGLRMVMIMRSHRFRLLFLSPQGVHLGLDRRRAHDGGLRDLDPLVGRHHANET